MEAHADAEGARWAEPGASLPVERLVEVIAAYEKALTRHRETINRLNVFPVPDGDTGTNMLATVEAVSRALEQLPIASPSDVCHAIAQGSLMGARGNSGVILCQILRGLVEPLAGVARLGPQELATGLIAADAAAHAAVLRPAEGTILTVISGAAAAAQAAVGADLAGVVEAAGAAARESLWSTPSLLPVLAKAGVVDAGGAGLTLLFDAFAAVVSDRPLPEELPLPEEVLRVLREAPPLADASGGGHGANAEIEGGLRYEVMYLLAAEDALVPAFKEVWAGIGDSIVVVGGDGLWNCHIHTNDVGAAIEAALDAGRPRDIRVTDLAEQVAEERWVREAGDGGVDAEPAGPPPVTSVVTVATGEGIHRIFRSLGVRHVVAGGQSMNPSTAELLSMLEASPGAEVVLLPNNSNIVPVARQAAELASKPCVVVATPGIQEGFAALLEYDPEAGAEENGTAMSAAAGRIVSGEVTRAVRSSETEVGPVAPGDWIGISRQGIESVAGDPGGATIGLLDRLVAEGHEIVTLIEGEGSTEADVRVIGEWLDEHRPGVVLERHDGGQPLYPFLVSIE